MTQHQTLRAALRARAPLVGVFYKSAAYQGIEVLGDTGLDCIVLDAEHAPFSERDLDICLMAARSVRLPVLVRVKDDGAAAMQAVLDMGATGVLVPHVDSADKAREVVRRTHYRNGTRGFSNAPRAGGYGKAAMGAHIESSDSEVAVLCQIEDRQAVEAIDEIVTVDGIDCLFIGRADLAVSFGCDDTAAAEVEGAIERVAAAGKAAGVPVGIFLPDLRDIARYRALGITFFLIGSDQSFLKAAVGAMVRNYQRPA